MTGAEYRRRALAEMSIKTNNFFLLKWLMSPTSHSSQNMSNVPQDSVLQTVFCLNTKNHLRRSVFNCAWKVSMLKGIKNAKSYWKFQLPGVLRIQRFSTIKCKTSRRHLRETLQYNCSQREPPFREECSLMSHKTAYLWLSFRQGVLPQMYSFD